MAACYEYSFSCQCSQILYRYQIFLSFSTVRYKGLEDTSIYTHMNRDGTNNCHFSYLCQVADKCKIRAQSGLGTDRNSLFTLEALSTCERYPCVGGVEFPSSIPSHSIKDMILLWLIVLFPQNFCFLVFQVFCSLCFFSEEQVIPLLFSHHFYLSKSAI